MAVGRRALPAIPLTTRTTTTANQQQQFNDDGGAATIATWRPSFVDEPGHYDYVDVNQMTGGDIRVEQRPTSSGSYQGLNPAELAALRQPPAPHHYAGIGSDQPRSRTDPEGHLEPVQESEDIGNYRSLGQLQQSSRPQDHIALRLDELNSAVYTSGRHYGEVNQRGYEGLDPSVAEQLRRPQRPHSYSDVDTNSPPDRSGIHSYLEVIGYSGTNNIDDRGTAAKNNNGLDPSVVEELRRPQRRHSYAGVDRSRVHSYLELVGYSRTNNVEEDYQGLDPAEVEEMRRRENTPHDYAGLTDGNSGNRQGEVVESEDYQGLDPVEVEEARQHARQPHGYAGLRDNVEDLYSRPIKKH